MNLRLVFVVLFICACTFIPTIMSERLRQQQDYIVMTDDATQAPPLGCKAFALRQCYNLLSKYYERHFVHKNEAESLWSRDDLICQMHHVKEKCFEINGIDANCTLGYRGVVASEILSNPLTAHGRKLPKQVFVGLFGHLSWRCMHKQCSRDARKRCWSSLPQWRTQLYQGMILEAHGLWTQLTALQSTNALEGEACSRVQLVLQRILDNDFCTSFDAAYCICMALTEKSYDHTDCSLACTAYRNMANGGETAKLRLQKEIFDTDSGRKSATGRIHLILLIISSSVVYLDFCYFT